MDQSNQKLAQEWFDSANSDYQYAEIGLKETHIFPQTTFLSQQVAEKFLKGYLALNGVEPPRIHELPKLLDECIKVNSKLAILRDSCELLAGFYVETRYPPNIPNYVKEDLTDAFVKAKLVKDTIEAEVK